MQLKPDEALYVQGGLGRFHKATAIFIDVDAANTYLVSNPTEGVIAVFAGVIVIAACYDLGIPLPSFPSI